MGGDGRKGRRALAVRGLVWSGMLLAPLPALEAQSRPEVQMFRGGSAHRGVVETRGVPTFGQIRWRFRTGGPVRSTPAVSGGVVFVGSSDGHLYAIDRDEGTPLWSFQAAAAVVSSPAVVEDLVVFGDRSNRLWGLDRDSGAVRWSFATGPDLPLAWGLEGWDYYTSSPTVVGDLVYWGSGDGGVHALEWRTGTERWSVSGERRVRSTPAVVDGVLYVGGGDGWVRAFDANDGSPLWTFETAGVSLDASEFGFDRTQIQASPAVADGVVYIGSRDASLYALDASTGQLLWHREDGSAWVVASAALDSEHLYLGRSSSGNFRAVDRATGEERWVLNGEGAVYTSATLARGIVYFGSGGGWVWAVGAEDGEPVWRYRTDAGVYSSPVVAEGELFVGSDDGFLYAIQASDEPEPVRAVFWDEALRERAMFGRNPRDVTAADYFTRMGYERVDASALAQFLTERIEDRVPSVVVFAMDLLPDAVAGDDSENSLLRRYLDRGGKVVWMGFPPRLFELDEAGQAVESYDLGRPEGILGADFSTFNTDTYGATLTPQGRRWGLERGWMGTSSFIPPADATVLAADELGGAHAWALRYGGGSGTGFVLLPPTRDVSRLREYRWVVELGVTWSGQTASSRAARLRP